jgi:hypothetical protein
LLSDELAPNEAIAWAMSKFPYEETNWPRHSLAASGLRTILMLQVEPKELRPALENMRSALKGERPYVVELVGYSREFIERTFTKGLLSKIEFEP